MYQTVGIKIGYELLALFHLPSKDFTYVSAINTSTLNNIKINKVNKIVQGYILQCIIIYITIINEEH